MANFCIPIESMKDVVKSIKGLDKKAPIEKLAGLSTKQRIDLFRKTIGDESATKLNSEFEKAITSQKINSLKNWVTKNLDVKYRKEFDVKKLENKFKTIDEFNEYLDANAENFILQKNNIALTADEIKQFNNLGKDVLKAQQKMGDDIGDIVNNYEGNLQYAKSIKKVQEYAQELIPNSKIKTFTSSIGKAMMLASIKSPLLNVLSNTVQGVSEAVSRRIANKSIGGRVDKSIMKSFMKNNRKIFKETGIDFSRMIDIDDPVVGAGKILGEDISTPKSKPMRAFTDFIFDKTLSTPDVAFSSYHFADSANIMSSRYGKTPEKATEIFKDSLRLEPKTAEGQIVRQSAIADAMYATFTNESATARLSMNIRKVFGPVGDIMMPFVKTPANVVESGLDYAGLGVLKGVYKMQKAIRVDGFKGVSKEAWREIARDVTRSGLGITGAIVLANTIDSDEFMGAYDPRRVGIDQLKNTNYNAIKIGNKWVNVDYFGPFAVPLVSMLYAKKYGDQEGGMIKQYARGMREQFTKAPGLEPMATTLKTLTSKDLEVEAAQSGSEWVASQLASRLIPGFMYDLAKATDDVQRDTKQNKYTIKTPFADLKLDKFVVKFPFLRETLPEKHDALGRVMYEEDPVTSLMFGARVRTSRDDAITDEIFRLRDAGFQPNVRDLRFSRSSRIGELKNKVGDEEFYRITKIYGQELAKAYEKEMSRSRKLKTGKGKYSKTWKPYKDLTDEEKQERFNKVGLDLYEELLDNYDIE